MYSGNIEGNIKANDNVSYSFSGYYEQRYNKITSDKYNVDEEEGTINVGSDSDEEILENLKTTWDGTIYKITGDKLVVSYNNFDYKEFTLIRTIDKCSEKDGKYYDKNGNSVSKEAYFESCGVVENPKTGLMIPFVILMIFGKKQK